MPRKSAEIIEKICEECEKLFQLKDTKRNRNRRFCSNYCAISNNGKLNKGRNYSDEVNKKKGRAGELNGFYGKRHTEEQKQNWKEQLAGKTWEELYGVEKASEMKENAHFAKLGEKNPFYEKTHTANVRKLLGRDVSGEKNPMYGKGYLLLGEKNGAWNGGSSTLYADYNGEFTGELKTEIRKRDLFTCGVCKKNGYVVHHIDYDKTNNTENNLITLCGSCHGKTNFNRNVWNSFFSLLMEDKYGQ